MTNATCVMYYTPLMIATVIILLATALRERRLPFIRQCLWFYLTLLEWCVLEMLTFIVTTPESVRQLYYLRLAFVLYVPVTTFFMYISFYRLQNKRPRWLPLAICLLPAPIALMAVIPALQPLLIRDFTVLSMAPVRTFSGTPTPLLYLAYAYSFLLVAFVLVVILVHNRNLPKSYRKGSHLMTLALVLPLLGTLAEVTYVDTLPLDIGLIGAAIGGIFFYIATLTNDRMDYLHIQRREAFQHLDDPVLILSDRDQVVDANAPAQRLFRLLDTDMRRLPAYSILLDTLTEAHRIRRVPTDILGVEDLYVLGTGYPLIYRTRRQLVAPDSTLPTGELVLFQDITNNSLFMERLRAMAGVDALTGLPNRFTYQQMLRSLDVPGKLPLSVIIGDLNGLKTINDTMGHHAGDALLQSAAGILRACVPEGGHVARIGGDEFIMLLPRCDRAQVEQVLTCIRKAIQANDTADFPLRMALGCATKERMEENINALIARADRNMYDDKR